MLIFWALSRCSRKAGDKMDIYGVIKKDKQITKFNFYGFFKNLRFFEPYLVFFLMGLGYSLFQIGILYSIREAITYIFEVPSGIMADQFGKKKVLLMCFVFYMISFVFFFWSLNFCILIVAMIFFGLGEAFRSGAHKALILSYLEHKSWYTHKGFVYGRTRAYSLLGSSLSAFISILMVLNLPSIRWVFLISLLPYLIDFMLVLSYPSALDEKTESVTSVKSFYKESLNAIKTIFSESGLMKIVISSATFDGVFKTLKDYIQPVLVSLITAIGITKIGSDSAGDQLTVYLGLVYGVFYIFSALASRNVYRLTQRYSPSSVFNRMYDLMGVALVLLAFALNQDYLIMTILVFFSLYVMKDSRKPVFVDFSSNYMKKDQRATVLSIESQLRSLLVVALAPILGWVADQFSLQIMFLGIGGLIIIGNRILKVR